MRPVYRDGEAARGGPTTYYSYEAKLRRDPTELRIAVAAAMAATGGFVRVTLPEVVGRLFPDYLWVGVVVAWIAFGVGAALAIVSVRMAESTSSDDFRTTN